MFTGKGMNKQWYIHIESYITVASIRTGFSLIHTNQSKEHVLNENKAALM